MIVDERTLAELAHDVGSLAITTGHPLVELETRSVGPGVRAWSRFLVWTHEAAGAGHRPALALLTGARDALERIEAAS